MSFKFGTRRLADMRRNQPGTGATLPIAARPAQIQTFIAYKAEQGKGRRKGDRVIVDDPAAHIDPKRKNQIFRNVAEELREMPPLQILSSHISVFSAEEILNYSTVEVNDPSYDPAKYGSVNDGRMGIGGHKFNCLTCCQVDCPGHFGRIKLTKPIYNPRFLRVIISILTSVCNTCGRILVSPELFYQNGLDKLSDDRRLAELEKLSKKRPCLNEGATRDPNEGPVVGCRDKIKPIFLPSQSKEKGEVIYKFPNSDRRERYTAEMTLDILNTISDEDARMLGFPEGAHPRNLIFTYLPVIPPIARPSVEINGAVQSDHLTTQYSKIVTANNALKGKTGQDLRSGVGTLYNHINKLFHGGKMSRYDHDDFLDIVKRLRGKGAIFRESLLGKRTDYCGRAVLSPETNLEFGEIGVPRMMAPFFTIPMTVTQDNYEYILRLLDAGKITHYTQKRGGKVGRFRVDPSVTYTPQIGDEVERWAQDGDLVVFNRQPTLQKESMMGYTIRFYDGNTIKLHPSSTTPHNADHDGDEGNFWFPRSKASIDEVRDLMHARQCIMGDKQNRPMVGLIMDSVTAAYLMTLPDTEVEPDFFLDCVSTMKTHIDVGDLFKRAERFNLHPYSGRTLFSALLPPDFYYKSRDVIIIDGILVGGTIRGGNVGTSPRSIVQDLWQFYGADITGDFITDATWMLNRWLDSFGFSIGAADCAFGEEIKEERTRLVARIKTEIDALGGRLEDTLEEQSRENKILGLVNQLKVLGTKLAERKLGPEFLVKGRQNAIGIMAKDIGGGAKSDLQNVAQIGGSQGQQNYDGARLRKLISRGTRCVPTRDFDDESIEARGYCVHSFWEGLDPEEFFFQMWGGREGLINTAKSTADVGEFQRKLTMALVNVLIRADGTVRNSIGTIFQFIYGGDNFDGKELLNVDTFESGTIPSFVDLESATNQINSDFGWVPSRVAEEAKANMERGKLIEARLELGEELERMKKEEEAI